MVLNLAFTLIKRQTATDSWRMVDNKRDVSNTYTRWNPHRWLCKMLEQLMQNNASGFDFLSNGFKARSTNAGELQMVLNICLSSLLQLKNPM